MQASAVELRDATLADAPAIARVYVETWREAYAVILPATYLAQLDIDRLTAFWAGSIHRAEGIVLVATKDGCVTGFCSGGREANNDAFFRSEIFTLYVSSAQQRHGVGAQLLLAMFRRLQARAPVIIWVLTTNKPARRFYERLGGVAVREGTVKVGGRAIPRTGYAFFDL
ncbi:MAG: GNAT family N-acetyltransferase [Deltaproteobacteria bacterium]|nr:GNAT family N-acetyltransferase [Deltaproteobacteria bacterium]